MERNRGRDQYTMAANQGRVLAINNSLGIDIPELHLWPTHHLVTGRPIRGIQQCHHEHCSVNTSLAIFFHQSHEH